MNKDTRHIVACFDYSFVMSAGVMMCSVCVNNPDVDIVFHLIVDESVTEDDRNDITETVAQFKDKRALFNDISSRKCLAFQNYHVLIWGLFEQQSVEVQDMPAISGWSMLHLA